MKKLLLSLAVTAISVSAVAETATFTQVTSTEQLVEGAEYVILSKPLKVGQVQYGVFAMANVKSNKRGFDTFEVDADVTKMKTSYSIDKSNVTVITLESATDGWYLKAGDSYISSEKVKYMQLSAEPFNFTITPNTTKTTIEYTGGSIQATGANGNGGIKGTVTINTYDTQQKDIFLYKAEKKPAGLAYNETAFNITLGDSFTKPTLTNPNELTVTYKSSNIEVATVDAEGNVTIEGVIGETTITATSKETAEFDAGEASYTLTVNDNGLPKQVEVTPAPVNDNIDAVKGSKVTFYSKNATKLRVELDMAGKNFEQEGDTYEHIAEAEEIVTVTPIDADGNVLTDLSAVVSITIVSAPVCGEVSFNPVSGTVKTGTEVTVAAENAAYFIYNVVDSNNEYIIEDSRIDGASFTYAVKADCTITATPYNTEDVPGTAASATYHVETSVTDKLTAQSFGVKTTNYTNYNYTSPNGISYTAYINGVYQSGESQNNWANNFAIRKHKTSSKSGSIAVTASTKVATGVTITQASSQDATRSAAIYGSYEPFTTGEGVDIDNMPVGAVELGTAQMIQGQPVKIELSAYYPYIIIASGTSTALQMSEIQIVWDDKFTVPEVEYAHNGSLSEDGKVTFTLSHAKQGARFFYLHEPTAAQPAARRAPSYADAGWTELTGGNTVEINTVGTFHVYATDATGKNRSDISSYVVSDTSTTGIGEVEAVADAAAEWFDLQGRRVANPAKGNIYIVKQGTKITKRAL